MRPKSSRYVARVRPNAWEVVSLIARQSRQALQIHGANAVRRFGLSTQMPLISNLLHKRVQPIAIYRES